MFGVSPLPRSLAAALRDAAGGRLHVRLSAIADLGRLAGDAQTEAGEAVSALLTLLSDPVEGIRAAAAMALADAKARVATPALVRAAGDVSLQVRQMAVLALGEVADADDARVVAIVQAAYLDAAPALRFQSLIAGNALGLPTAETALLRSLKDDDDEVRHVAMRLLEERAMADSPRARLTEPVRAAVRAALLDPVLRVRVTAAILLGSAGDVSGAGALLEALESGAPGGSGGLDGEDEQAAIHLAGELGLIAARPVLARRLGRRLFGRDRFVFDVRIALARLKDPHAADEIMKGLAARSRDDRTLAVVAAGRARLISARDALLAMKDDERRAEPQAVEDALSLLAEARAAGDAGAPVRGGS